MADGFFDDHGGAQSATRALRAVTAVAPPADAFGPHDTEPLALLTLEGVEAERLALRLGVDAHAAELAVRAAGEDASRQMAAISRERPELLDDLRRIEARTFRPHEAPLHIVDVRPEEPILSDTPFALIVDFQSESDAPVAIVSTSVGWAGDPFVVEIEVDEHGSHGRARVAFDEERTLPVGAAEFTVTLLRDDGAKAVFRRTV